MRKHLTLKEVHSLALQVMLANRCDEKNARAVADTVTSAEADSCQSHGLFRMPGYVASIKSGKVNGAATPSVEQLAPGVVRVDGDNGFAPLALMVGREPLARCARDNGIAALSLIKIHHFAPLWIEVSALAEMGLCAFAFTAYMPTVAPVGGMRPFFGTNPMAFGWPRSGNPPMVFDQSSAGMARGDVMIAARDAKEVPIGIGLNKYGEPTTDSAEILEGVMLPFAGHKGSSIALMIELLVGALIGERASFEAAAEDNKDGGPPRGGELLLAIDPDKFGDPAGYSDHTERIFQELLSQEGTRLPADRRYEHRIRAKKHGIDIPESLYEQIIADAELKPE